MPVEKTLPPENRNHLHKQKKCAFGYENAWYNKYHKGKSGYFVESQPSLSGNFKRKFDNKMSSVKVTPGCKLFLFEARLLSGVYQTYSRNTKWFGEYNDLFSSYVCTCEDGTVDVSLIESKCSVSSMTYHDTCQLYQLSDLSWNTVEDLEARARNNHIRGSHRKGWEGGWAGYTSGDGSLQLGYVQAGVSVSMIGNSEHKIPGYTHLTKVGVLQINSKKDTSTFGDFSFGFLEAEHTATAKPFYIGTTDQLNIVKGRYSIFDIQIGIGVSTDIGYDIDSHTVSVEELGFGATLGGETGVCWGGNCFKINFNRLLGNPTKI